MTPAGRSRKVEGTKPGVNVAESIKTFSKFAGLDLGGGKGKTTALALLELRGGAVVTTRLSPRTGESPLYDAALIAVLRGLDDDTILCVDAPLVAPACLRCAVPVCPGQAACVDPAVVVMRTMTEGLGDSETREARRGKPEVTPYTQRVTEVFLQRRLGFPPRETLGQGMGPLTARALHIVRAISDKFQVNRNLIEVSPKATLAGLFRRYPGEAGRRHTHYKKRVDARLAMLEKLPGLTFAPPVWRESCVQSDHAFDAIICAFAGYLRQRDGWQVPEDMADVAARDGWIWTAPVLEPDPVPISVLRAEGQG